MPLETAWVRVDKPSAQENSNFLLGNPKNNLYNLLLGHRDNRAQLFNISHLIDKGRVIPYSKCCCKCFSQPVPNLKEDAFKQAPRPNGLFSENQL